jgi:hypothetical protein
MMGRKKLGKNSRKRHQRNRENHTSLPFVTWMQEDEIHAFIPGKPLSGEMIAAINREFQNQLRKSPLWQQMVERFGEEEAEELLTECRMQLR